MVSLNLRSSCGLCFLEVEMQALELGWLDGNTEKRRLQYYRPGRACKVSLRFP
jgi:hypothetical protein